MTGKTPHCDEATDQVSDTSAGNHVLVFDWEPNHLAWYIDGKLARTMICTDAYAAANPTADWTLIEILRH